MANEIRRLIGSDSWKQFAIVSVDWELRAGSLRELSSPGIGRSTSPDDLTILAFGLWWPNPASRRSGLKRDLASQSVRASRAAHTCKKWLVLDPGPMGTSSVRGSQAAT